jgi:hypothetical protein
MLLRRTLNMAGILLVPYSAPVSRSPAAGAFLRRRALDLRDHFRPQLHAASPCRISLSHAASSYIASTAVDGQRRLCERHKKKEA